MAELTLEGHEEIVPIPDGEILAAEVTFCDESTKTFNGEEKQQIKFKFKIADPGEFKDRVLTAEVAKWFSTAPSCRLRPWVLAILGEDDLPVGFKFETTMLVGMPCRVVIGQRPYKAKDGTSQIWNFVSDVIAARQARTAQEIF